jgi:hypothetical protein
MGGEGTIWHAGGGITPLKWTEDVLGPVREIRSATANGSVLLFYLDGTDSTPHEIIESAPGSGTFPTESDQQLSTYPCFDIYPVTNSYVGNVALFCVGLDYNLYYMLLSANGAPKSTAWQTAQNTSGVTGIAGYLAPDNTIELFGISSSNQTWVELKETSPGTMVFGGWNAFSSKTVTQIAAGQSPSGEYGVFGISTGNIVYASYRGQSGNYSTVAATTAAARPLAQIAVYYPQGNFGFFAIANSSDTLGVMAANAAGSFLASTFNLMPKFSIDIP